MKQKSLLSLVLAWLLVISLPASALAVSDVALDKATADMGKYMCGTVSDPQVGSIGGEWAIMGLARSGYDVPKDYYQNYYDTVVNYVQDCKGVLHRKKYTEYSRLIVALTSIGKDPNDVGGYNLLTPLGDYDKTILQGLNGPIWALIALDSGNYDMPTNLTAKTQASRECYIQRILDCQLSDGGWSLFGGTPAANSSDAVSDPDITGMALQALAKYQDRADVKKATDEALTCMSKQQDAEGGYSSWGVTNSESIAQMLIALTELGIPIDDSRFVKNGNTMLDNLMTLYRPSKGFQHMSNGESNQMATEQAFCALIASQRAKEEKPSLYRITDASSISNGDSSFKKGRGLKNKHQDIKRMPVVTPNQTFPDLSGDVFAPNQVAIEALAARGIINGKSNGNFQANAFMTRAEFSAIVVRALGLPQKAITQFADVHANDWFSPYVGSAYTYGIVKGTDAKQFTPQGTITRQEAAVMVTRAAKLCGMNPEMSTVAVRDMLAQFGDYVTTADWSRPALAFCYAKHIVSQDDLKIRPKAPITRGEISAMIYNLLKNANLL